MDRIDVENEIRAKIEALGFNSRDVYYLSIVFAICRLLIGIAKQKKISLHSYIESNEWRSDIKELDDCIDLSNGFLRESEMKNFESICEMILENVYYTAEQFYSLLFPYAVANWNRFTELLHTDKKLKDGQIRMMLIAIQYLARDQIITTDRSQAEEAYKTFTIRFSSLQRQCNLSKDEFVECWKSVYFYQLEEVPVLIDGDTKTVIQIYKKHFASMNDALSDYETIRNYRSALKNAYNPYAYIEKGIKKRIFESGVSAEEKAFNKAAERIKDKLPTDVIRSLFYPNRRNDTAIECSFVMKLFNGIIREKQSHLIVNPCPDYILQHEKSWRGDHYYAVPDQTVANLYNKQFPGNMFITYSEALRLSNVSNMLILVRDYPINRIRDLFIGLNACAEQARILALIPSVLLDSFNNYSLMSIMSEYSIVLDSIVILPPKVSNSSPKKKVLCWFTKTNAEQADSIPVFEAVCDDEKKFLIVRRESCFIHITDIRSGNYTIAALKKRAEMMNRRPKDITTRNRSLTYYFSQEIEIVYVLNDNRKGKCAAQAYYCQKLDSSQKRRLHGKKLSKVIEKGLRAETKEGVLERLEDVVFDNDIGEIVCKDILGYYNYNLDNVTIKTVWFCCRNELINYPKYDEKLIRQMLSFSGKESISKLPVTATSQEYAYQMSNTFDKEPMLIQFKYWEQLDLVFQGAIKLGYISHGINPIRPLLSEYSNRASAEQQEARNALVKKTFTHEEIRKMLDFICADTNIDYGSRKAKRYEVESIWLVVVIRLFTGMTLREICALQWGDFIEIADLKLYQFRITKFVGKNGEIDNSTRADDWKKYRLVPLPSLLANILNDRKSFLKQKTRKDDKSLDDYPIIFADEKNYDKTKKTHYCKLSVASSRCKKVVDLIGIPELPIDLPGENDTRRTDVNRYYGDIFATNFKYYANHYGKLIRGEINYILGIDAPDTFSRHYCDYTNDFVQLGMARKIQRWSIKYALDEKNADSSKIYSGQFSSGDIRRIEADDGVAEANVLFEIGADSTDASLTIDMSTDMGGYKAEIVCYTNERSE